MNFEIKKLKVHPDMSEETLAFSAELWIEGKKAVHVSNDGRGGCHLPRPFDAGGGKLLRELQAYAKTLPAVVYHGRSLDMDLDMLLDDRIERMQMEKSLTRMMKGKVFWMENGKMYERKAKGVPEQRVVIDSVLQKYPGVSILNIVPMAQAVDIWLKWERKQQEEKAKQPVA